MKEIQQKIRQQYPHWAARKAARPRPDKATREANGRRPNAAQVYLQKHLTLEIPEA